MKRMAFEHPKLARLKNALGLRRYAAVGLLESLWHFTARYAPGGDIGKWSNEEIAEGIDWEKDAALLIETLVKCAWLDANKRARLVVHDWHAHADDAVHMQLARARKWFSDGQVPKLTRLPKDDRDAAQAFYREHPCARNTHGKRNASALNLVALPSHAMGGVGEPPPPDSRPESKKEKSPSLHENTVAFGVIVRKVADVPPWFEAKVNPAFAFGVTLDQARRLLNTVPELVNDPKALCERLLKLRPSRRESAR